MMERDPKEVAREMLAYFDRSGYGTDRKDRWTPHFDTESVVLLAKTVLACPICGEREIPHLHPKAKG